MNNIHNNSFKRGIFGLSVIIFLVSCQGDKSLKITKVGLQPIIINNLDKAGPLTFEKLIDSIRYVFLLPPNNELIRVDKIIVTSSYIYILDNSKHTLQIYGQTGKFMSAINNVTAFNIYKHKLYTYNMFKGEMRIFSGRGSLTSFNNIGFRGVDFTNLSDSLFAFHTGGLVTSDKGSIGYEIAYIKKNGLLDKFAIEIPKYRQSVNYIAANRFSFYKDSIYFIPSLCNCQYQLKRNKVVLRFDLNFGSLTLTDPIFDKIKEVEDYNLFPYILNVTNRFNTSLYSFYSCTYIGTEAYFIVNRMTNKVMVSAISGASGVRSGFNNTIPVAFYGKEYVSVIEKGEFISNQKYLYDIKGNTGGLANGFSPNMPLSSKGPVLMFYTIKNLNSYNGTATDDHH